MHREELHGDGGRQRDIKGITHQNVMFFRAQIPKVDANLLVGAGENTWKINDILREIKIVRSGSLNQQEKLLQTKHQINRSIFGTCMLKKNKNLGI